MTALVGRLGGFTSGLDLTSEWDGQQLRGHIGSYTTGKNIAVWLGQAAVEGRVGGFTEGFDLRAEVGGGQMKLRLGSFTNGVDVALAFTPEGATGRYGSYTEGMDINLRHYAGEVRGRFGGVSSGLDFRLDLGDVPLPLGVLQAVCAYKLWQEQEQLVQSTRQATRR